MFSFDPLVLFFLSAGENPKESEPSSSGGGRSGDGSGGGGGRRGGKKDWWSRMQKVCVTPFPILHYYINRGFLKQKTEVSFLSSSATSCLSLTLSLSSVSSGGFPMG